LGWSIVLCDKSQTTENLDQGIFLYREDTGEFFCDLEGHMDEPVFENLPQYLLGLSEVKDMPNIAETGYHFVLFESKSIYFANPTIYDVDQILSMLGGISSLIEVRLHMKSYAVLVRLWPLSEEEVSKLNGRILYTRGP
jgi:hypothetical protein